MYKRYKFYLIIGFLGFIYTLIRAILVPPYLDEINSFFFYIKTYDFIPFIAHNDANNHFLNSLLSSLFYYVFGDKIIFLRIANVLSSIIFFYYLCRVSLFLNSKLFSKLLYITLISSTYLIDFFILSRGYGLSISFFTASIFYLVKFNKDKTRTDFYYGLLMSSLALWSNLVLIVPIFIIVCLFVLLFLGDIKNKTRFYYWDILLTVIISILPILVAVLYTLKLRNTGSLYFGSEAGLIESVFIRLSQEFAGSYLLGKLFLILFSIIYVSSLIVNFFFKELKNENLLIQIILWMTIIGYVIVHNILGVNYPQERAALQFILLFILAIYFSVDKIKYSGVKYLFIIPILIIPIQFIILLNFKYIQHWKNQTVPFTFYEELYGWQEKNKKKPLISGHGILSKVFNFYDYQNNGALNIAKDQPTPSTIADFLITNNWQNNITNYDTLIYDEKTSVALLKRKEFVNWDLVLEQANPDTLVIGDYYTFFKVSAEQFINRPFCYELICNIQSSNAQLKGLIMCIVTNKDGERIAYDEINLQMLNRKFNERKEINKRQFLEEIPPEANKIELVVWIIKNKKKVSISEITLKLYKLK